MEIKLNENESLDDLQLKGLKIIQKKDAFRFGIDAVLLSEYAEIRKNDVVVDFGTGTGILPILLCGKTGAAQIIGLEIQQDMVEMAQRSVLLNSLEHRINIIPGDIKDAVRLIGAGSADALVTNPPYMTSGGGLVNPLDGKAIARHEILCCLEDVVSSASKVLKTMGRFAMVHRPHRLVDIIFLMRKYGIEPKALRFVLPYQDKSPNMVLIRGVKGGRPELKVQGSLVIYNKDGSYTDEILKIYGREIKN